MLSVVTKTAGRGEGKNQEFTFDHVTFMLVVRHAGRHLRKVGHDVCMYLLKLKSPRCRRAEPLPQIRSEAHRFNNVENPRLNEDYIPL